MGFGVANTKVATTVDLGSRVYVKGRRFSSAPLRRGDVVRPGGWEAGP